MKRIKDNWIFLVWLLLAVILFWPVLGYYQALPSPDSGPYFVPYYRLRLLDQLLSGAVAFTPHHLLKLLLPPLLLNDLVYLLDVLLIAAGGAWFLRGRGLTQKAAWIGGGILAFAGYSFTLVAAGHMGFFHMGTYVVFMFGALVRALQSGRWRFYALTGVLASWVIVFSPDFGPIYLILAAAYGSWWLISNAGRADWRRWLPGLLLAGVCFVLSAWPSIRSIFEEQIRHRESQIAATAPPQAGDSSSDRAGEDRESRWIFATNWSLPPGEIVEFVAPNLYGTQTGDPRSPYWGRLGRTLGWDEHHEGFYNFRQHTVYLGALQLLLAAFGVGVWWRGRRQADQNPWIADIPFWAGVWAVGLMLALGRHAPFYRLFYSLPYMSLLRAPVKFIRFVEFATAVLAATGAAALLEGRVQHPRRWIAPAAAGCAVCLTAALWCSLSGGQTQETLTRMQLSPAADLLQRRLFLSLLHGSVAFGVAATIFALAGKRLSQVGLPVILAGWLALDTGLANYRYIQVMDMGPHYRTNSVVRDILGKAEDAPTVANYLSHNIHEDWFSFSFAAHGILNCVPSPRSEESNPFRQLHTALQDDPIRYWELCGARHILLPLNAARSLAGSRLKPLSTLQLGRDHVTEAVDQHQAGVLAEVPFALPYAWLSPAWSIVPEPDSLAATVADAGREHAIVSGTVPGQHGYQSAAAGRVAVEKIRYFRDGRKTVLEVDTPTQQFLTVRMQANQKPGIFAKIDGAETPVYTANHCWLGIEVPAGRHRVEFYSSRVISSTALGSALGLLLFASLGAYCFATGRKNRGCLCKPET